MASGGKKKSQKAHHSSKTQGLDTLDRKPHSFYELSRLLLKISLAQPSVGPEVLLQLLCPLPSSQKSSSAEERPDGAASWQQSLADALPFSCLWIWASDSHPLLWAQHPLHPLHLPSPACHSAALVGSHLLPLSISLEVKMAMNEAFRT